MAERETELARRRDRLALRAFIEQAAESPRAVSPADSSQTADALDDVELGDHVAAVGGGTLWVLGSRGPSRVSAAAAALAWIVRQPADSVRGLVLVDRRDPGVTARRLARFAFPSRVLSPSDGGLVAVPADPHLPFVAADPRHLELAAMFSSAGADVVVEHGVVAAEVAGLEVARIVEEDGVPTPRIGVGLHDRDTFRMMHGEQATVDQLRNVVREVAARRRPGAGWHPLNLLARERALRHRAVANPSGIGMTNLAFAEPPVPRGNVKDDVPCCALGRDVEGEEAIVVFVSGVDLDVVPFAADARDRSAPAARLVIVTEKRNVVPIQSRLAGLLAAPAKFVGA